jgi:hypothetical protein
MPVIPALKTLSKRIVSSKPVWSTKWEIVSKESDTKFLALGMLEVLVPKLWSEKYVGVAQQGKKKSFTSAEGCSHR